MGLFKQAPRSRAEIVSAADDARAKGRLKAAAEGYRRALAEHDPADPHVNGKLAPLLARLGDADGARASFLRAAEGHARAGFDDRALAVCTQARDAFPLEPHFHREAARLHLVRGRRADAAIALARGGQALARERPADAIGLLRGALALEPGDFETSLLAASLLRRAGRRGEALALLAGIAPGLRGARLRRVRWQVLRAAPGIRAALRWAASLAPW